MIETTTLVRVRYGETDQMGYVYHGCYAQYYEIGRVEMFRDMGLSYRELERTGYMMPVLKIESEFLKPAFYDDQLTIITRLKEIPQASRISFDYELFNQDKILIHKATVFLCFASVETGKAVKCPAVVSDRFLALKKG